MSPEIMSQECRIEGGHCLQLRRNVEGIRIVVEVSTQKAVLTIALSSMQSDTIVRTVVSAVVDESSIGTEQIFAEFELIEECVTFQRKMGIPANICFLLQTGQDRSS